MPVRHQFAVTSKSLQRLLFQDRAISVEIVEYRRFQDEEAGVDPGPVPLRFFLEPPDQVLLRQVEGAEPPAGWVEVTVASLPCPLW